ncbi:MAG: histone deacetylase [Cyanobacteria bacterium SBLK]|nr:histone deacetylase [Cyanobacteria bacterium SBLK]
MQLPIIYSERFLYGDLNASHPERPRRLLAIVDALKQASWYERLQWCEPKEREGDGIERWLREAHLPKYIKRVKLARKNYQRASLAASAWLDGADLALATNQPVFVLSRPAGHHAERDRGMGFCVFCNAAIAALYALKQSSIERVAILDWDVHHGNGTQQIVERYPQIAFCSLHQFPGYPGTGTAEERGKYDNVLNIPMSADSTAIEYRWEFEEKVLPFLSNFAPDLLIVSAGYDANRADPLAEICLEPADYRLLTEYTLKITRRVIYGLEGGYNLDALAESVKATIEGILG